jgi:hypothetical protein
MFSAEVVYKRCQKYLTSFLFLEPAAGNYSIRYVVKKQIHFYCVTTSATAAVGDCVIGETGRQTFQ